MRNDAIELNDGRVILLEQLSQWHTYSGLLEGTPTREINQAYLANIGPAAPHRLIQVSSYLAPPRIRKVGRHRSSAELEWLPHITCVAIFESDRPARDPDAMFSSLQINWLQDRFALPIADDALEHIKAVDWAALADDGWI